MAAAPDQAGAPEDERAARQKAPSAVAKLIKRCLICFKTAAPPAPCEAVKDVMDRLGLTTTDLLNLYRVFFNLRLNEDGENGEARTRATSIFMDTVPEVITERRFFTGSLIQALMRLGGAGKEVHWDTFAWVIIRFCELSRTELPQCLMALILNEAESEVKHYVTREQLADFFEGYRACPIHSFSTQGINFERLPLSRYYAPDFVELTYRFPQLINPLIHVQQNLQAQFPSAKFWDSRPLSGWSRKISSEHFQMEVEKVYLFGVPPFQETCDMLAPDALGPKAVNQDQWLLRTKREGKPPLKQISIWGEQPCPEELEYDWRRRVRDEILRREKEEELRLQQKLAEQMKRGGAAA